MNSAVKSVCRILLIGFGVFGASFGGAAQPATCVKNFSLQMAQVTQQPWNQELQNAAQSLPALQALWSDVPALTATTWDYVLLTDFADGTCLYKQVNSELVAYIISAGQPPFFYGEVLQSSAGTQMRAQVMLQNADLAQPRGMLSLNGQEILAPTAYQLDSDGGMEVINLGTIGTITSGSLVFPGK